MEKMMTVLDEWLLAEDSEDIVVSDKIILYGFYSTVILISGVLAANLYF